MSKTLSLLAILLFLCALPAKADSFVVVTGTDIKFEGLDTLNLSVELDTTTRTIVPGAVSISLSGPISLAPFFSTFVDWPIFNNNALFDFDNADGERIQLGVNDYVNAQFSGIMFPAPGDYTYTFGHVGSIINSNCGPDDLACEDALGEGFSVATSGSLTVTAVPEPEASILFGLAVPFFLLICGKQVSRSRTSSRRGANLAR